MILKNRYKIEERVSVSSSSIVYKGVDLQEKKPVAIKKINFHPFFFDAELTTLKNLNHKAVIKLVDYFQDQKDFYLITQWFSGYSLSTAQFLLEEWVEIFLEITKGLLYIHENGISHRDLKPQNILINKNKEVKIIDFGISIFQKDLDEKDPQFLGTLPYMAPEQTGYLQKQPDQRSDIYSLGVIFYECLTGINPFYASEKSEIIHKHLSLTPKPIKEMVKSQHPKILKGISDIIQKMLEKNSNQRYVSVDFIVQDLEKILTVKFPLQAQKNKIIFHQTLIEEALSSVSTFLLSDKKLFLIKGKFGSGKSFVFKKIVENIRFARSVLELKVIDLNPFSFIRQLLSELGENSKNLEKIFEIDLPVLAIENLQRMDEPSWNYLLQKQKLLILGTYDEDEDFPVLKNLHLPLFSFQVPLLTQQEIRKGIDIIFDQNIEISLDIENKIYAFCQGNPSIFFYLFQLFYDEKVLVCKKNKWVFEKHEKIFLAVEDLDILNYRFSMLDEDLISFLKDLAIYGFSFYFDNLKKVIQFPQKKVLTLKKFLKKVEEQSILEKNNQTYTFMNRNIHQHFYLLTPEKKRQEKHLKFAQTIERIKVFENRFFLLFYHYSKTPLTTKAYIWGNRLLIDLIQKYAYHQAVDVFEQLAVFFKDIPNKEEGDFLHFFDLAQQMVNIYVFHANYDKILEILQNNISCLMQSQQEESLASAYMNIGRLYTLKGSIAESKKWYQKVMNLVENIKNPKILARIYEKISMNYIFSSRFREAIKFFEKAQNFYQPDDYQDQRMISLLGVMAFAYANLGFSTKTQEVLMQLENILSHEKNPHVKTIGLHYSVLAQSHLGQVQDLEEEVLEEYLAQAQKQENRLLEYSLFFSVGYFYYRKRKLHKAFQYISRSVKIGEDLKVGVGILAPYLVLSEVGIRLKHYDEVRSYFSKMKKLIAQNKDLFSFQWYLRLKALLLSYKIDAKEDKIKKLLQKAINYAYKMRLKPELARNYYYYSMVCFNLGDFEKGQIFEKRSQELFSQLNMEWEQEEIKSMVINQTLQTTQHFFGEKVRLEALSKVNQLIAKQKNAEDLLLSIMQSALEISGATKGALFLKINLDNQVSFKGYFSHLNKDFTIPDFVLELLEKGKEPYLNHAHEEKSFIYLPLRFQNQLLGVVYLENDLIANLFNQEQVKVMNILSAIFGVLLENARTYRALEDEKKNLEKKVEERTREVFLRNQVIEKDLSAARVFQENLMPKKIPNLQGVQGAFFYRPVEEIGGDFYDFISISKTKILFAIADSAGHGIRASLLTAMFKTALFNYPDKTYQSIFSLMEHINNSLYGQISDKYVVALIGILDTETKTVYMMGGGNISLYSFQASKNQWEKIPMKGHMLGIIPTNLLQLAETKITLHDGDKIFLTTDGMIEEYIRDASGHRKVFGDENLLKSLQKHTHSSTLLQDLIKDLQEFTQKSSFSDDLTAILFQSTL